jgi:hypothetical protein
MWRDGGGHAIVLPEIDEHLIEDQKRGSRGSHNEKQAADENYRTIATRWRALRTLSRKLSIENLDELFWC